VLSPYFEGMRAERERFRGREVKTTGDGMLVTFDGSGRAIQCAAAIRRIAREHGLELRLGVHVGEVEIVGSDIRGVSVHEAARITAKAAPGVSPPTRRSRPSDLDRRGAEVENPGNRCLARPRPGSGRRHGVEHRGHLLRDLLV
jgi:class 3 adenylate cyclase